MRRQLAVIIRDLVILLVGIAIGSLQSAHGIDLSAQERQVQILQARVDALEPELRKHMFELDKTFYHTMLRLEELEAAVYGPQFEDPWRQFPPPNWFPPDRRHQASLTGEDL